jgi:hypothetical protein
MKWSYTVLAIVAAPAPAPAQPIEVMVLGTYHFANPGLDLANVKSDDVLKPQRQKELEALSAALAQFRPTKIMIERQAKTAELLDPKFAAFTPADLAKNRDERVQVAYRLAGRLGLKSVYAIDEQPGDGEPDYFPFGTLAEWAKTNGRQAQLSAALDEAKSLAGRIERWQAEGSVSHALLKLNRPDQADKDQSWYYGALRYGDTDKQPGAELNAYWYMRNAKIFGKLMIAAKPGDRVLVVYGSGHNYWLRHFAKTTPGFQNIDPTPYLKKAEKGLH